MYVFSKVQFFCTWPNVEKVGKIDWINGNRKLCMSLREGRRRGVQYQFSTIVGSDIVMHVLFVSAVYYCFNKYSVLKETHPNDGDIVFTTNFQYYVDLYQTWLALGAPCSSRVTTN